MIQVRGAVIGSTVNLNEPPTAAARLLDVCSTAPAVLISLCSSATAAPRAPFHFMQLQHNLPVLVRFLALPGCVTHLTCLSAHHAGNWGGISFGVFIISAAIVGVIGWGCYLDWRKSSLYSKKRASREHVEPLVPVPEK
jgi:hypothetical protein